MKKIRLLSLLLLTLLPILSCSKDGNDDNGFSSAALVGTWDLVEINLSAGVDLDGDGQLSSNLLDEETCISGTLVLKDDTTYQYEQSSFNITAITNDQYYVDCFGTNSLTGAWASDGTEIAFQGNGTLGILQLDGNRIIKNEDKELPGVATYIYEKR